MSPRQIRAVHFVTDYFVPALLIVMIPVLMVGYVLEHNSKRRVFAQQLAACERGNLLRIRINHKFAVYDRAFVAAARSLVGARTQAGKELHDVLALAAGTAPDPLPLTACRTIYTPPRWFWQ